MKMNWFSNALNAIGDFIMDNIVDPIVDFFSAAPAVDVPTAPPVQTAVKPKIPKNPEVPETPITPTEPDLDRPEYHPPKEPSPSKKSKSEKTKKKADTQKPEKKDNCVSEEECGECYCNRDFTVKEVRTIIKALRKTENIKTNKIWVPVYKSGVSPNDKTYTTMTNKLNIVMRKYHINTCIRKIHFLAQVYHETDRFRAMTEYTSRYTQRYDPYRGRGLVHLTHGRTYKKFADYMNDQNIYTNPSVVATNINYAFEAGGWYWENIGKVTATNENINFVADKDNVLKVSQCINGRVSRPNGLKERIEYTNALKGIFEYDKNH